ncbi:T9SS type B sorting domain-containing protein [Polaribacter sp. IC073]|uniref:T9SS type B sorting domain-containing protein n=1 Tax=Polaribacter sp. IC073 TaxID=2508540 RepID=UPI0011BDB486|nr:T9SS type B sorting domain-containing protein [Polaribacter sp. IC073]TXD48299.1 T9SS type B sorting domain-containing protein [Polaribacter sp. IC073]
MKNILSFLLLFITLNVFSQKEANFWYFGNNAGLDFTGCNPLALANGKLNTDEGCSTISKSNGELLFYSDGTTVWNKDHNVMPGGSGLLGNSSSAQSALFVPNPINKNLYYLFVVGNSRNPGFFYYTIDLNTNAGLGSVIDGPVDLNNGNQRLWTERVTAIESNKSDEFWIISTSEKELYSYKVTRDGVAFNNPAISFLSSTEIGARGSLKISPDGTKLVITSQSENCLLYDFNTTTGTISNKKILNVNGESSYGAEFSQSSNKLYISTGGNNQGGRRSASYIFQYNLTENTLNDINNSKNTITSWSGYRGALQLGPDAKIYYARSGEASLGVINKPEEEGINVNYVDNGVSLGGRISSEGLPPFIQSFFKVALTDLDTSTKITEEFSICSGDIRELGINSVTDFDDTADTTKPIKYQWFKDDVLITTETNRKISVGGLGRTTGGIYSLKVNYTNNCGRERNLEAIAEIVFYKKPTVNIIDVYEQCDFDSNPNDFITSFNLTTRETAIYTGSDTVKIEFFETTDTSFNSPIAKNNYTNATATNSTNGNHKVVAKVTNVDTDCYQTIVIELKVNPYGIDSYSNVYSSELDQNKNISNSRSSLGSLNSFYNLDDKTNKIIANSSGALTSTSHDFSYFRTREDATLQNDKIVAPYEDDLFANEDEIFVRISLKGTNACESIGKFTFILNILPIPQGNPSPIILCVSNPIDAPQPFTENLDADTGAASDTYAWYLNETLLPSETNAILEANKEGTYRVEASRGYENDTSITTDNSFTTGYNTFTVLESNEALLGPESITFIDDQDNPTDNTITIKVTGKGDYEYALNNNALASFVKGSENLSYTFINIPPGLNKVYIRDRNNCGRIINTKEISFIYFQRHFTPNGDGYFDTWKILGVENTFYSEVKLQVFDRYGKNLKNIDLKTNAGWNGTYNGKPLPSNDYWYNAILIDISGNIRKKTGHFSLLRK